MVVCRRRGDGKWLMRRAGYFAGGRWAGPASAGLFAVASATDWLDGHLARRLGQGTEFGRFLDPVADKLMVTAGLVVVCAERPPVEPVASRPWLVALPAATVLGREIAMSALREWAAGGGREAREAVGVSSWGKAKTVTQMGALSVLLALKGGGPVWAGWLGASLLVAAAAASVLSFFFYLSSLPGRLFG